MNYSGDKPSRLFRDLLDLEKDFRYNLNLLKIREEEIERCSQTNRILQQNLKSSLGEIERLNAEISNLMTALQKAEQRRLHQDQIHQCNMNKLTQDMALLQQEYRLRIEDYKRRSEMEEREVEKEYLRKMEVLEAKVMEEKANNNKLKADLKQLLNENVSLQNSLKQVQSQNAVYTDKLKSARATATNLNSEIARLKDELVSLQTHYEKIQLQNENFRRNDEIKSRKIDELIEERQQFIVEMEKLKMRDTTSCTTDAHDKLLKQNSVLQEVIKALRKEKGGDNVDDTKVAEQSLDRLDMLMCQLKNVY